MAGANPFPRITINDLPREVIRLIALRIYDPLEITQQDRLTWGIFSTVDMHQERQDDLAALIALGQVSRKIRREVRRILFTCVRIPSIEHAEELIENKDGWARYVKSIIIDLNMFDLDDNASTSTRHRLSPPAHTLSGNSEASEYDHRHGHAHSHDRDPSQGVSPTRERRMTKAPRSCWAESALLTALLNSLPSLNHLSFFADASDDSTLALLFASLIPHPSLHAVPPAVLASPSALSAISASGSGLGHPANRHDAGRISVDHGHPPQQQYRPFVPLPHRLRSFGWRQRATPPALFRQFSQSSTFVSTLHLLRHAHNLSFLVLDADMDEMTQSDVLTAVKELSLRQSPMGERPDKVSLMLCGPISGWNDRFLRGISDCFREGIKELFFDRPLRKSAQAHATSFEAFTALLHPLESLPHLRLLQVGSYTFTLDLQSRIALHLARAIPSLLVLGLMGEEGETNWWGIWRRASQRGMAARTEPMTYDEEYDTRIKALEDGDLRRLEDEVERWIRSHPPTPPSTNRPAARIDEGDFVRGRRYTSERGEVWDVRMTPSVSPLAHPFPNAGEAGPTGYFHHHHLSHHFEQSPLVENQARQMSSAGLGEVFEKEPDRAGDPHGHGHGHNRTNESKRKYSRAMVHGDFEHEHGHGDIDETSDIALDPTTGVHPARALAEHDRPGQGKRMMSLDKLLG
ncbi:hypothetical protein IAU60_001236 [Kwoniella sp. DSM 27419]